MLRKIENCRGKCGLSLVSHVGLIRYRINKRIKRSIHFYFCLGIKRLMQHEVIKPKITKTQSHRQIRINKRMNKQITVSTLSPQSAYSRLCLAQFNFASILALQQYFGTWNTSFVPRHFNYKAHSDTRHGFEKFMVVIRTLLEVVNIKLNLSRRQLYLYMLIWIEWCSLCLPESD
jgi:hypothetical protein